MTVYGVSVMLAKGLPDEPTIFYYAQPIQIDTVPHVPVRDREQEASTNPARLLKRKHEDNGRVRFLNQLAPAKTDVECFTPYADEESWLRAVILSDYPDHMPEFEIALHTGIEAQRTICFDLEQS
jgi:hypothetical protein